MASRRIEDYAYKYKLSNSQAKRRIGGRKSESDVYQIVRGGPVKGTGKKGKGVKKGAGGA